ncbi:hypothetical protein [Shimia sp.]|uniref:hypothetical protein n=1 Tax=Shimia sp. TaxID=1954381 RepID=UPI003B8CCFC8
MTTIVSYVSGNVGAAALGKLSPTAKEQAFYNLDTLKIAGSADAGRRGSEQGFTLEDRLHGETFEMAEVVSSNVAPVHVANVLNGHGALVFGGESVGGSIVVRNGALVGATELDLSTPFSLVMIGHGNGNGPEETSGAILSVGGDGHCFAIRQSTTGAYQAALDDDSAPDVQVATSAQIDYGPEDYQIVIASFDPVAGTITLNVNDADVVENSNVTLSAANGPLRFGQVKDANGGYKWAARESRVVQYGFFSCDLNATANANLKAVVLDYYREVAGL